MSLLNSSFCQQSFSAEEEKGKKLLPHVSGFSNGKISVWHSTQSDARVPDRFWGEIPAMLPPTAAVVPLSAEPFADANSGNAVKIEAMIRIVFIEILARKPLSLGRGYCQSFAGEVAQKKLRYYLYIYLGN